MINKAHEHLQAGELQEAETLLKQAIAENPEHAEAMFVLAQVRQQQGDFNAALELLQGAERLEPFNPNICHARGTMHINLQQMEEAGRAFQQALDINPEHAASRNGLAFIELAAGRLEAAEHAADQVLSEEPENAQALTYKGTARLELGKPQEAIVYLQEALRLEPEALTAQAQLGRAFLASGNAGFAAQCFENALQRAPGAPDILEFLGRAQLEMGEAHAAIKPLREALEKGRSNPELFRDLAACETVAGQLGQAEGLLQAALQMVKDDPEPRLDLVLPLAELQLARRAAGDALSWLEPLAEKGTDDEMLDILISRGKIIQGDPAAAVAAVQPRSNREDASDDARLAYVEALDAAGKTELAAEELDKLLAAENPSSDALFYKATKAKAAGDESVIELLQDLVNRPGLSTRRLLSSRQLLAEALHQHGRYAEAAGQFDAIARRDAEILHIDADFAGSEIDPSSAMDSEVTADWPTGTIEDDRRDPVFVIGWPGSGQERILPALAAHPEVTLILDPSSTQGQRRAHIDRPRGAEALQRFDDAQVDLRRGRYRRALESINIKGNDKLIIDGMWLTVDALPTIARLFPGSRVLLLGRDPRDMSIAWMMSGYRNLPAMASAYSRELALLERCKSSLPLEFLEVDYDVLAEDPGTGLNALQSALGLEPQQVVQAKFAEIPLTVEVGKGDHENYAAPSETDLQGSDSDAIH